MIPLDIFIYFYQAISLLSHTDFTKRVRRPKGLKAISRKTHRYTRVCHPAANTRHSRQARAKRRAICEIREICVKISHLRDNVLMRPP